MKVDNDKPIFYTFPLFIAILKFSEFSSFKEYTNIRNYRYYWVDRESAKCKTLYIFVKSLLHTLVLFDILYVVVVHQDIFL